MHYAAITVLLIQTIHIYGRAKYLHCLAQIYWFRLYVSTQLQSDEVALAKIPVHIKSVAGFLAAEWSWMHSQLHELLAKFVKDHITQVLHLRVHVALPLYPFIVRLAQNVKLNKVLVPCEESQSLEELGPRH